MGESAEGFLDELITWRELGFNWLSQRSDHEDPESLPDWAKATLDEHAALMLRFPDMQHDEPWMAHVPPGKTGQIVWNFNRAGEFAFACLISGHYQAGMVGKITVSAK